MPKNSDKRATLLQAALELMAENGLAGSPTALIAKRAGVANGTLFLYFKNKEELIRAVFQDIRTKLAGATSQAPAGLSPQEQFAHMMAGFFRFFLQNPNMLIFCEYFHFSSFKSSEHDVQDPLHDLRILLVQARTSGIIKNLPTFVLESIAIAPLVSIAKERVSRGVHVEEELIDHIIEACWDGLKR